MTESKVEVFSTHHRLYSIGIWQDYSGTTWSNISTGIFPEGLGTHTYPKGNKPKSLFWKFCKTYSANTVLTKAVVILHIAPLGVKALPVVKAFIGDSNAPYKKSPVCTVKTPSSYVVSGNATAAKKGYHVAYYPLTGVTISDLKNIIIECDWSANKATDIGIGFLGINVFSRVDTTSISMSSELSSQNLKLGETVKWVLTGKQYGTNGTESFTVQLPSNVSVTPIVGSGTYKNGTWTLSLSKSQTGKLTFEIPCNMIGSYELIVKKGTQIVVDDSYTVEEPDVRDVLISIPNDIHVLELGRYVDIYIKGISPALDYSITGLLNNHEIIIPFQEVIPFENDSINIDSVVGSEDYKIHINPINESDEYYLHIKLPVFTYFNGGGCVVVNYENKEWSQNFIILEEQHMKGLIESSKNNIQDYNMIESNIGIAGIWSIRCKSHYHNYFEFEDDLFNLSIEDPIAYIGSIPIHRPHSRDVTSSVKNSEIKTRYLNRAYYGKKGDYSESIGMTLRLPPKDVASLQGFVEFDKPVPIDLIPTRWEGDPLNHRGWAELYEVNNIKIINENLYECEPVVDYLTHEINTKFNVIKGTEIYPTSTDSVKYPSINTYVTQTHNFGEDLTEIMDMSPAKNQTPNMDTEDGVASVYNLEPKSSILYESINNISNYGDWNIRFRNHIDNLEDEDYDGNWEMSIRLVDDEKSIFDHTYYNYKHKSNEYGYNKCGIVDTIWNGSGYEVINYDDISLNTDELAPIIPTTKHKTEWVFSANTFTLREYVSKDLYNKMSYTRVRLVIENTDGSYKESWDLMTDGDGKIVPNLHIQNGDYNVSVYFEETDTYLGCESTELISIDNSTKIDAHFDYEEPDKFIATDSLFTMRIGHYEQTTVEIIDEDTGEVTTVESEDLTNFIGVNDLDVYYGFTYLSSNEFNGMQKLTSATIDGEDGVINIPITYNNGKIKLKVWFKGDDTYNGIVNVEEITINIDNNDYTIEADDIEYTFDLDKTYYATVTRDGSPIRNTPIKFMIHNEEDNIVIIDDTVITNENGVVEIPIYLGLGLYKIDINLENTTITKTIIIKDINKLNTNISTSNPNITRGTTMKNSVFNITLKEGTIPLEDKKILFTVRDSTGENILYQGYSYTEESGIAYCPYYAEKEDNNKKEIVEITATFEGDYYHNSCTSKYTVNLPDYVGNSTISFINYAYMPDYNKTYVDFDQTNLSLAVSFKKSTDSYYENVWFGNIKQLPTVGDIYGFFLPSLEPGYYDVKVFCYDTTSTYHSKDFEMTEVEIPEGHVVNKNYNMSMTAFTPVTDKLSTVFFKISDITDYNVSLNKNKKFVVLNYKDGNGDLVRTSAHTDYDGNAKLLINPKAGSIDGEFTFNIYDKYYDNVPFVTTISSDHFPAGTKKSCSIKMLKGLTSDDFAQKVTCEVTEGCCDYLTFSLLNKETGETLSCVGYVNQENQCTISFNLNNGIWVMDIYNTSGCNSDFAECLYESEECEIKVPLTLINSFPTDDSGNIIITPPLDDPERYNTFGSDVKFEFRDGLLNFIDYGMLFSPDDNSGGKIIHNDIKLDSNILTIECEVRYGNLLNQRIQNLEGLIQVRTIENTDVDSETIDMYSSMVCSPSPVPNNHCYFTRKCDEGILYYFKEQDLDTKYKGVSYIGSPYNQYKGGTDLQTDGGISIFNLENGYSPVFMSNGLIRCAFHKYSGYISIQLYNPNTDDFETVNTFKIVDNLKLELVSYSDDKIILNFGDTKWTMWRGHPFVELQHENTTLQLLNIPNRVYCETLENEKGMVIIGEKDIYNSEFDPRLSTQLFRKELEIGENMSLKNIELKTQDETGSYLTIEYDMLSQSNALKLTQENAVSSQIIFPTDDFLEKDSNTLTFSMQNVQGMTPDSIVLRGFDIAAKIPRDGSPYDVGVYQETIVPTVTTNEKNKTCEVIFRDIPAEVKYIDFILNYSSAGTSLFNRLMLNEGDVQMNWQEDTTYSNLQRTQIYFNRTYYANFYNDYENFGLSIMRPTQESIYLSKLPPAAITVLAPYWKKCKDIDNPNSLLIEYTKSKNQEIDIDWLS